MKNIRIFWGNPPVPVVKLWKNAFAQSTEGIFLLYLITSVIVESVRNNSLTYSWIEILLMAVTMGTIRRYYIRHKRIYLMVFENVWHRLNRYMVTPSEAVDKKIQALTNQALEVRRNGHLPGFAAYLSSVDYTRLESMSQKIVETAGSKGRYWNTFILICIVSYAIVTIGTMIKDFL